MCSMVNAFHRLFKTQREIDINAAIFLGLVSFRRALGKGAPSVRDRPDSRLRNRFAPFASEVFLDGFHHEIDRCFWIVNINRNNAI